jgi:intracellular septation protein
LADKGIEGRSVTDSKTNSPSVPQNAAPNAAAAGPAMKPGTKAALDLGPLLIFFITYFVAGRHAPTDPLKHAVNPGLMWATGALVAATLVSLGISYALERKIHILPVITGVIVLVFGALTIIFHDDRFIKMKPTIVYALFAAALLSGLAFRQLFIKVAFGSAFHLTDTGWRVLTWRWSFFFIGMAILNEIIWRSLPEPVWVSFKFLGATGLTAVFAIWQTFSISRHQIVPEQTEG